jgi:hypothetical protein
MVLRLYTSLSEVQPPREVPLCFFCLAGARSLRAGGADSVKPCPPIGGHPKGSGLDGIRGDSYAVDVPAKQKRVVLRFHGLLLTDYYLQEGIQTIENPRLTLRTPSKPA